MKTHDELCKSGEIHGSEFDRRKSEAEAGAQASDPKDGGFDSRAASPILLSDFPSGLLEAFYSADDPMWRAGIARAAAILMRKPSGNIATIIHLLRESDRPVSHDKLMQDAAAVLSRIPKAIEELHSQIDGGEECKGRDSQISYVIGILEGNR